MTRLMKTPTLPVLLHASVKDKDNNNNNNKKTKKKNKKKMRR